MTPTYLTCVGHIQGCRVLAVTRQSQTPLRAVLAVLSLAAFLASLDLFIVNVAFSSISRSFHGESLGNVSWVLNGYTIIFAALLVPLGRLCDRVGRKKGFVAGLALFTAASAACAGAPGLWWLVAARVLQAVGAAALTPSSLGLLIAAFPPERRAAAVRVWAATGAVAAALGPVVGGVLVEASWRWVFLVNVPIGIGALVATLRIVPDSRDPSVGALPDMVGAAVLTGAIGALSLGLVKGTDWGFGSGRTLAALAAAAVLAGIFVYRTTHHPVPLVEPALVRVRAFAWANVTALLFGSGFAAGLLVLVLWLQDVWGWSAIKTGLAVAPGPLMVPIFAAVGQRLARRVPVGLIACLGCVLFAVGGLLITTSIGEQPHWAAEVLPGWIVGGIGVGFALPTILSSATADLPQQRASTGSAIATMSRQVGAVVGVSVLVALLGHPVGYSAAHAAFQHGYVSVIVAAVLAALAAPLMTPRSASAAAPPRPQTSMTAPADATVMAPL